MKARVLTFKPKPDRRLTPQQAMRLAIFQAMLDGERLDETVLECVMRILEINRKS